MMSTPNEDLEDLYENAPCGYLSLGSDGRIVKVNRTFTDWVGYSMAELIGRKFSELLNIAGRIYYETHFAPLMRMQGYFNEVALDLTTKNGEQLPVIANAVERRDAQGNLLFTRVTIFKSVDRRRYERELLEARAASQNKAQTLEKHLLDKRAIADLREQFIAVLGHDLRNPLGSILTSVHLLGVEPLSERGERACKLIAGSVERMSALINDVLDFARGRLGGGLSLENLRPMALEPVLRQVIGELQTSAADVAIQVELSIDGLVYCDATRIGQLLSNLLGNALTHGDKDVPIGVRALANAERFEISVANGGQPIPHEAQAQLFQPFFRGAVRPSKQGLGLGLYIASEIAKAHGGTLTVESSAVETRFTFVMRNSSSAT